MSRHHLDEVLTPGVGVVVHTERSAALHRSPLGTTQEVRRSGGHTTTHNRRDGEKDEGKREREGAERQRRCDDESSMRGGDGAEQGWLRSASMAHPTAGLHYGHSVDLARRATAEHVASSRHLRVASPATSHRSRRPLHHYCSPQVRRHRSSAAGRPTLPPSPAHSHTATQPHRATIAAVTAAAAAPSSFPPLPYAGPPLWLVADGGLHSNVPRLSRRRSTSECRAMQLPMAVEEAWPRCETRAMRPSSGAMRRRRRR